MQKCKMLPNNNHEMVFKKLRLGTLGTVSSSIQVPSHQKCKTCVPIMLRRRVPGVQQHHPVLRTQPRPQLLELLRVASRLEGSFSDGPLRGVDVHWGNNIICIYIYIYRYINIYLCISWDIAQDQLPPQKKARSEPSLFLFGLAELGEPFSKKR